MKRNEIHIRDPFVLTSGKKYYLYGSTDKNIWGGECTSFSVYESDDLETFSEPREAFSRPQGFWSRQHYWAPEVHEYKGNYYMFASFSSPERIRGSQILKSDSPLGKFLPITEYPFTPDDWSCLDATLYVENGVPYAVFCHEWTQIHNGEICCVQLSEDLTQTVGKPEVLFSAENVWWTKKVEESFAQGYITDGPFLYRLKSGKLLMIWSSNGEKGYAVGMAVSDSGSVRGPFRQVDELLFENNGGHAMLFKDLSGKLYVTLHAPNTIGDERPCFLACEEYDDRIRIKKQEEKI